MTVPIDHAKLRALCEAIPAGPWDRTSDIDPHWMRAINVGTSHAAIWSGCCSTGDAHAIIAFIAAANPAAVLTLLNDSAAKQAEIDRLMLEFCPGEMSAGQLATWGESQRRAPEPTPQPAPPSAIHDGVEFVAKATPLMDCAGCIFEHFGDCGFIHDAAKSSGLPGCGDVSKNAGGYIYIAKSPQASEATP